MAAGAAAAAGIVLMAVRQKPQTPIVPSPLRDLRRHVLVVTTGSLDDSQTTSRIARIFEASEADPLNCEIRVLVPARGRFMDRWSGERRPRIAQAQRYCVHSVASFATAGLEAEARVGDEDVVLAVEDELRDFPATDVLLVTHPGESQCQAEEIATELRARLQADFLHLHAAEEVSAQEDPRGGPPPIDQSAPHDQRRDR